MSSGRPSEGTMSDSDTEMIWLGVRQPDTKSAAGFKDCFGQVQAPMESAGRLIPAPRKCQIKKQSRGGSRTTVWIPDFVKVKGAGPLPAMSASQFYSLEDLDRAFGKVLRPEQYDLCTEILTVDPAFRGGMI